jgi:hypothetical protein
MKPAVLQILTFSFLLICAASCRKSAVDAPALPKSKTVLLTQTSWKIQSVALDQNKDGISDGDATSYILPCKLDNTYTFKTDGTGTMDEAAAKCNETDPQTQPFTWVFKNTETILSGTFSFTNGDATIVSMNDTNLVVTYDDNLGTPTTYHILATLQH